MTDAREQFMARARPFVEAGVLAESDVHAIALTAPRFGEHDVERMLGLAFAVRAPRVSHPGVDLRAVSRQIDVETAESSDNDDERAVQLPWPAELAAWAEHTFGSPMVGGPRDKLKPFVRQVRTGSAAATLLLTRRMYVEQVRVAQALAGRMATELPPHERVRDLEGTLQRLFPDDRDGEAARAVRLAATRSLALIVGGPGTGKTYSVTRLLAALLEGQGPAGAPPTVALAAPTGKAAARMREAIREATDAHARPSLNVPDAIRARLQSLPATTLHRLIGIRPDGSARHGVESPIPAQVVIVDEVSMVDLTLMRQLLEAVHPSARLVLLGDRDQLASVEAGCVLADLAPAGGEGRLAPCTQTFTHSRRFESAPDIALIAACLQSYATRHPDVAGQVPQAIRGRALGVFEGEAHAAKEAWPQWRIERLGPPLQAPPRSARPSAKQLERLAAPYLEGVLDLSGAGAGAAAAEPPRHRGYAAVLREALAAPAQLNDPVWQRGLLACFDRYRVLAVHRRGPLGVQQLERELARRVRRSINGPRERDGELGSGHWVGRPVLITENAYDVGLMNGDVGIVLALHDGPAAIFPHELPGEVRAVALSRLPSHEGALAMTVHKSQGSQFDHVALVLAGRDSPIQTRELVYTGVTRARQRLSWLGSAEELRTALERQVRRESGLGALIEEREAAGKHDPAR